MPPSPPLTRSDRFWYGLGQLAEGLKNEGYTVFLLFYYTSVVGLSGALTGQAILIALLFDAVTDPLIGSVSDRLRTRWGRRHPLMFASALPLPVFFFLTFAPPAGLSELGLFAWLATFAVLTRAAMTLFHVPHLAGFAAVHTRPHCRRPRGRPRLSWTSLPLTRRGISANNTASRLIGGSPAGQPFGVNQPFRPRTVR